MCVNICVYIEKTVFKFVRGIRDFSVKPAAAENKSGRQKHLLAIHFNYRHFITINPIIVKICLGNWFQICSSINTFKSSEIDSTGPGN